MAWFHRLFCGGPSLAGYDDAVLVPPRSRGELETGFRIIEPPKASEARSV
jgi:hypothetical protein